MNEYTDMTGMNKLRHLVKTLNNCTEVFLDRYNETQLLRIMDAFMRSGWDIYPHQWTPLQRIDAVRFGLAPAFTRDEEPITYECSEREQWRLLTDMWFAAPRLAAMFRHCGERPAINDSNRTAGEPVCKPCAIACFNHGQYGY